ncbi:Cro/CI family transcriptional regulator [Pseudomonas chlororaphis]|uniref:Cro/CI family transcriptional regulator n=1 Tax=Pseudomonas chlororaphis TaxID=587753 RepID=UPI0024087E56|nr:Cro/CI family transcriptional regulator [Pseudomonas chlororaphis]
MQRIPLAEYAARRHALTASRLGMSQGALSKAIREGRSIFVLESDGGCISAVEEKPFPGQRRENAASSCPNSSPPGIKESAPEVPVQVSSTAQASR